MPPPEWNNDFTLAVDVYRETVMYSARDNSGRPTMGNARFVMDKIYTDHVVNDKAAFFEYLSAIHNHTLMECR